MQGTRTFRVLAWSAALWLGIAGLADAADSKTRWVRPPDPSLDIDYQKVIAPLIASKTWAFFTSCRLPKYWVKHVMVFPVGASKGFYGEFAPNGLQEQGADITVGKTIEVNEFMGGFGTVAVQMKIVKGMLRSRFQLVEPSKLEYVFKHQPVTRICDGYRR